MKVLCVKCRVELRNVHTGVYVNETAGNPPRSYKLWHADLYACPVCGMRMIVGFGNSPIMCEYEPGFDEFLKKVRVDGTVIDDNEEFIPLSIDGEREESIEKLESSLVKIKMEFAVLVHLGAINGDRCVRDAMLINKMEKDLAALNAPFDPDPDWFMPFRRQLDDLCK